MKTRETKIAVLTNVTQHGMLAYSSSCRVSGGFVEIFLQAKHIGLGAVRKAVRLETV